MNSEVREKIEGIFKEIEELKAQAEKNATDIDTIDLKINQKINEIKKIQANIEAEIRNFKSSHIKKMNRIKIFKKNTVQEINQLDSKYNEKMEKFQKDIEELPKLLMQAKKKAQKPKMVEIPERSAGPTGSTGPTGASGGPDNAKSHDTEPVSARSINQEEIEAFEQSQIAFFQETLEKFRREIFTTLEKTRRTVQNDLKSSKQNIESNFKHLRSSITDDINEIKEKLTWLPMNTKELQHMTPPEARMFVLEMRLRSEENMRNEQISRLYSIFESFKTNLRLTSENIIFSQILPSFGLNSFDNQTPDLLSLDRVRKFSESIGPLDSSKKASTRLPSSRRNSMSVDIARTNLLRKKL